MPDFSKERQELRKKLKRKVLDRVLSPESGCTIHNCIKQNEMFSRMRAMRQDIPEDHKSIMRDLRDDFNRLGDIPRAVLQLNAIERLNGSTTKWASFNPAHIMPESSTLH